MTTESETDGARRHIPPDQPATGYHRVVADLALAHTPDGGQLIDIGCGLGHVLGLVRERGASLRLVGADPYESCLEAARQRVDGLETRRISVEALRREELGGPYDTAVLCHSLEHMKAPAEALGEALAVVRPGGHLVLAVPNLASPIAFLSSALRRRYVNRGHVCAWDRSHWMNFLENVLELQVVEYRSDEVPVFPRAVSARHGLLKRIEWVASEVFPWLSFSNIAVVRAAAPAPAPEDAG